MFYESRRTSPVLERIHVPLLVCLSLALPWLVTCGRDNPTQSRSQIPTRVVVTPETADLSSAGQSVRLNAQVTDDSGQQVADASVTWRSSDSSIATVSDDGVVTAVR
ncbi:MAG: Ig-like domain-containing protein, partial [Gemmatimonadota bacterium]|nr:Ig-like domain-containing protein [Gemmatimonadota bacterium]